MPRSNRGGKRTPRNPAPVAGPGALSQRTDGQPIRLASGGDYGDRAASEAMQQAAPLAAAGQASTTGAPAGSATGPQGAPLPDVFGPTARPGEPITAGAPLGAGPNGSMLPDDPDAQLRALYEAYPHPDLLALLEMRAQ